jgi:hypothetical protein
VASGEGDPARRAANSGIGDELSAQKVLERVPQQAPFRFIDAIHELDREDTFPETRLHRG